MRVAGGLGGGRTAQTRPRWRGGPQQGLSSTGAYFGQIGHLFRSRSATPALPTPDAAPALCPNGSGLVGRSEMAGRLKLKWPADRNRNGRPIHSESIDRRLLRAHPPAGTGRCPPAPAARTRAEQREPVTDDAYNPTAAASPSGGRSHRTGREDTTGAERAAAAVGWLSPAPRGGGARPHPRRARRAVTDGVAGASPEGRPSGPARPTPSPG